MCTNTCGMYGVFERNILIFSCGCVSSIATLSHRSHETKITDLYLIIISEKYIRWLKNKFFNYKIEYCKTRDCYHPHLKIDLLLNLDESILADVHTLQHPLFVEKYLVSENHLLLYSALAILSD